MTLEEHIINCLPYLIDEKGKYINNSRIHYRNQFSYCECNGGYELSISDRFKTELKTIFNIDGDEIYNILSKYFNLPFLTPIQAISRAYREEYQYGYYVDYPDLIR